MWKTILAVCVGLWKWSFNLVFIEHILHISLIHLKTCCYNSRKQIPTLSLKRPPTTHLSTHYQSVQLNHRCLSQITDIHIVLQHECLTKRLLPSEDEKGTYGCTVDGELVLMTINSRWKCHNTEYINYSTRTPCTEWRTVTSPSFDSRRKSLLQVAWKSPASASIFTPLGASM